MAREVVRATVRHRLVSDARRVCVPREHLYTLVRSRTTSRGSVATAPRSLGAGDTS